MRPALQRLLARPSSLDLLRYLTGSPAPAHRESKRLRKWPRSSCGYSSCAATALESTEYHEESTEFTESRNETNLDQSLPSAMELKHASSRRRNGGDSRGKSVHQDRQIQNNSSADAPLVSESPKAEPRVTIRYGAAHHANTHRIYTTNDAIPPEKLDATSSIKIRRSGARHVSGFHGKWRERTWTHEELEFESDLFSSSSPKPRLLDSPIYRQDLDLLAGLLEFRQRMHGLDGVRMYWKAIRRQKLPIPMFGSLASNFWKSFLTLGFSDASILQDIWRYADDLLETTGQRWALLYVTVVEHLLLTGQGQRAQAWHNRLFERHPPGPRSFAEMCRQVCLWNGDLSALKYIYERNCYTNAYAKIVPLLCEQQKYKIALEWHFLLVQRKDLPNQMKSVESLLRYYNSFDHDMAKSIAQSLITAEVSFSSKLSSDFDDHMVLSAEMMNIIHGKTFNIPAKKYNDHLGARWFATTWISLDVAMSGVHALGIQEIGPLSLQAIALRETDAQGVIYRINQLEGLGISIGESVFSRAIYHFARTEQHDFLEGLLQSDQHPDSLEDWKLQEALLASYAQANEWSLYRRTLAIRVVAGKSREGEAQNVELRSLIFRGDLRAAQTGLSHMQFNKIPIHAKTINYLIMKVLRKRQRGRRPIVLPRHNRDLEIVIEILKDIMRSGIHLSSTHWREIIRRLGMMGRLEELYRLSIFLAEWHNPVRGAFYGVYYTNVTTQTHIGTGPRQKNPAAVPNSHPLHPLQVLFPAPLQKSIVEWGFIKALGSRPKLEGSETAMQSQNCLPDNMPQHHTSTVDVTSGIKLLQRLQQSGVHIDIKAVRSAIFDRLVQYYGHGFSKRLHNRTAKANNPLTLEEMVGQINSVMGGHAFPRIQDLKTTVETRSLFRMHGRRLKAERLLARNNAATHCISLPPKKIS